jgi:serine/threonine protein kinase
VLASYLDEGGMGRVYLALTRSRRGEQLCVLKKFGNPRSRFSAEQVRENQERFRRESEISLALLHPCIGRTLSSVADGPESYLVQEFIDGMTLDQLVSSLTTDSEHLAIPLVAHIAAQIARALDYVHDYRGLGLVHRDLTPSNVMLAQSGDVKVIDFGIAKATLADDSLTRPHVLVGKPLWTAPEVVDGQKVDRRADLYALGLLFWHLLSRQDPEGHLDASGGSLPPPSTFNPEVSSAIDGIVQRAIHANPNRRFQTAAEFLDAISPLIPPGYDGAKALAHQVYRYESALKKEAIAGDVARARPLLAAIPPVSGPSWKWTVAIIAPLAVVAGIGIWFLFRQEPLPAKEPAPRAAQTPWVSSPPDASALPADARPSVVTETPTPPRADLGVLRPAVSSTTKHTRESPMPPRDARRRVRMLALRRRQPAIWCRACASGAWRMPNARRIRRRASAWQGRA